MADRHASQSRFQFQLQLVNQAGDLVHTLPLRLSDFDHATRAAIFTGFRRGLLDQYYEHIDGIQLEPVFARGEHPPTAASGFSVSIPLADRSEYRHEFEFRYFHSLANRTCAELVRGKICTDQDELRFQLHALLDDQRPEEVISPLRIDVSPPSSNLEFVPGSPDQFGSLESRNLESWDRSQVKDLPVVIDRGVLEEAVAEARDCPDLEIAGFLLGQVMRDEATGEVCLAVTGLVSARSTTEATAASVTFTPESFSELRNLVALRGGQETTVGWYHSHPFKFCAECPLPTPPACISKVLFFSADDIHLMQTTFEQPYMVGLLAAVEPRIEAALGHLPVKLFGWRDGQIKARGFDVADISESMQTPVSTTSPHGGS